MFIIALFEEEISFLLISCFSISYLIFVLQPTLEILAENTRHNTDITNSIPSSEKNINTCLIKYICFDGF